VSYAYHRTVHTVPFLWRLTHQLHHGPQRIDIAGSVVFHPIEMLIQRPEAHCEHHRLGVHAYNYGDLPLWDLLFGSFRNPSEFTGRRGFESPRDCQMGAMLVLRDVNAALYGSGSRGAVGLAQSG
jgi:sterol desaturase/sphingolipid hydroxylase (fatty acid hydroxylase superfamily)